jgi:hypothetical protein
MAGIVWWTDERLAYLREVVQSGKTYRQASKLIAKRYGRKVTVRACRNHGQMMHLLPVGWPKGETR